MKSGRRACGVEPTNEATPESESDENARLAALEWMLTRLATSYCLRQPDPTGTAERIHDEGVAHSHSITISLGESTQQLLLADATADAILRLTTVVRGLVAAELPLGS